MAKFGIGQAVRRVEDQRFLLGRGAMSTTSACPGMPWRDGAVPHAHARIKRVDVSKAKAAPGVLCVLTGADARRRKSRQLHRPPDAGGLRRAQGPPHFQPVLNAEKVRFVGDRVAFVVAETQAQARDAAELMEVDYEPLPRWSIWRKPPRTARPKCGRTPEGQCRLPADVRQPGRHRCGLRQGQARGEAARREQPPVAGHHGAAGRDRRLQRGRRSIHALCDQRRTRTACAWRCRISFMSRRTRFAWSRPTSAAVSA